MNDTGTSTATAAATQAQPEGRATKPLTAGAEDSRSGGFIYVNLRAGEIAITSNEQFEGSEPASTTNADGKMNHFFALRKHHITGYVTDIRWHVSHFKDGDVGGWNITIDTGSERYVLGVNENERPFSPLMNTLLNVDFHNLVMFRGFLGNEMKNGKATGKKIKMLLLSQEMGPEDKPVWLKGAVEQKWLSREIAVKLRDKVELTEKERESVSWMNDGTPNREYPYIREKANGKWSFEAWEEFLITQMNEIVIPSVKAANAARGSAPVRAGIGTAEISEEPDVPEMSGPATAPAYTDDDDIPF